MNGVSRLLATDLEPSTVDEVIVLEPGLRAYDPRQGYRDVGVSRGVISVRYSDNDGRLYLLPIEDLVGCERVGPPPEEELRRRVEAYAASLATTSTDTARRVGADLTRILAEVQGA